MDDIHPRLRRRNDSEPIDFLAEPVEALLGMRAALGHLLLDLEYEIARRHAHQTPQAPETDRAVLLDEAGHMLGMTKDYLYRHWTKLGGYRDTDGHIKFAMSAIQRHVRRIRQAA